jgi:predicted enzyme related to lactoylglutathione lyase
VDVFTSDPERARAFYGTLFGWEAEAPNDEFGGYFNFTKDGVRIAGGMRNDGSMPMDVWSVYLAVTDAAATVQAGVRHGADVYVPATPVGELGTMAVLADAGKAAIGLWQPGTHPGFQQLADPGTPSWFELLTRDYDASVAFYRDVFGWDVHTASDAPEMRYTTLGGGESMAAGIMDASGFLPEGVPAHWSVYFGAASTDATLQQVVSLGGKVLRPAEDTPYGRLAIAADPTGAVFKLVGPNA